MDQRLNYGLCTTLQRHQESYIRRELQWETIVERLQQQLAQLKGEGNQKAAEDAAEGQAKQLNTIRYRHRIYASCVFEPWPPAPLVIILSIQSDQLTIDN